MHDAPKDGSMRARMEECRPIVYHLGQLQAELHGVKPVHDGQFEPLQQSALRWSNRLKQGVAVCNSLVVINKSTVVGADMERSMFKAVEARFLVSWLETILYVGEAMH